MSGPVLAVVPMIPASQVSAAHRDRKLWVGGNQTDRRHQGVTEPSLYGQLPFVQQCDERPGERTGMTRLQRHGSWHSALSFAAACGLALGSSAIGADSPYVRDGAEFTGTKGVVSEPELDSAFQTLGVSIVKPGVSSVNMRKQAISELPLSELTSDSVAKVNDILNNMSMFRRLPTLSFEVDPDVYNYLLRHPDVTVATWRAMEISKFQLNQVQPNCYDADAGDGSVGRIEVLRQTPTETLIHCDGAFKSPLLPRPIIARALMRLHTSFTKEADGRVIGTHSGDVFVEFPSQAVETVARVISPVSHSIADRNFKQISLYAHLMTQAMARHPGWIEMIGNKLTGVTAQDRQQFLEVSARSNAVARRRVEAARPAKPFTPDDILSPFRLTEGAPSAPLAIRPAAATARD